MPNFNEVYFIKMLFRILVAFVAMILICVATFNINDSVPFTTGEIIAEVPQIDYKAPFEAIPFKIFVEEGKTVKKGDTLMVLVNEQLRKDYRDAQSSFPSLQKVDTTITEFIYSAYRKVDNLKMERKLNSQVQTINKIKELEKEKSASHQELEKAIENLRFLEGEIRKQFIISELDGEVMNVYNLKFTQNFINKGDLLLSVVPKKDKYYAKVMIPQRDI